MRTLVETGVNKKIQNLHASVLPRQNADKPWIGFWDGKGNKEHSYKDIYAQAHCVAAYLLGAGVKKGEAVAIISAAHPLYLALDLALQYIGAVNLSLPLSMQANGLRSLYEQHPFSFIFISDAERYRGLEQMQSIRQGLKNVVIFDDNVEGVDPDKIITFERLVNQGKAIWRENPDALTQRKSEVRDEDLYSLVWREGKLEELNFATLAQLSESALQEVQKIPEGRVLCSLNPRHLEQRIFGFFAPMMAGRQVTCIPTDAVQADTLKHLQPSSLVVPSRFAGNFFKDCPEKLLGNKAKGESSLVKAARVYEKYDEYQSEGKKVPVLTRMKYSSLKRGLFSKVKKQAGGKLHSWIIGPGPLDPQGKAFWTHAGFELRQPNS